MSINISLCLQIVYVCKGSFFRLCYDDSVQAEAVFSWRPDVAVLEAGRGQSRRKTRASWRPDAGALEAGRGQSGRKMRAIWRQDAGLSYFLAVLYQFYQF
jgi:hypothetical protein